MLEDSQIGLLAPAGTLVPLALHVDRNYGCIAAYVESSKVEGFGF